MEKEKKLKTNESDQMIELKNEVQQAISDCVNNSDVSNEAAMAAVAWASLWAVARLADEHCLKIAAIRYGRILLQIAQDADPSEDI